MTRTNKVLSAVGAAVVVVGLIAVFVIAFGQISDLRSQHRADAKEIATLGADLSAASDRADTIDTQVKGVKTQVDGVKSRVDTLAGTSSAVEDLTKLGKRVTALETVNKHVCNDKTVSNTRSSLYGQASADETGSFAYYDNLQSVITAACGADGGD